MCYGKSMEQRKLYSKLEIIMNENIHYF